MNERRARAAALLGLLLIATAPRPAGGTGLYSDLPWWFSPVDTARARILAGDAWVRTEREDASVLTFETAIRTGGRTSVRVQLMYPVIRRPGGFVHGFGDALIFGEARAAELRQPMLAVCTTCHPALPGETRSPAMDIVLPVPAEPATR